MAIEDFKVLKPATVVDDLLALIEDKLQFFSTSEEFISILEKKRNENQHTLSFCVYMTNDCKSKYYFARENAQKGSHTIDIAVYKGAALIFTIEAKLLPTPIGTNNNPRNEYEYVYGNGAGIQRFKDGNHGRDNLDALLNESGLIAFVKENDFEFWHNRINQWVIDARWDNQEVLKKVSFSTIARLISKHNRGIAPDIVLHHFWVSVATTI